uniref:Phage protein n=2 Tax=Vibrio TaxID=662 RepID=A0A0H3ZLP0_9VIBR|nr:Phage protein [Vibrio cyclitrophicus]AKN38218.1 hypothetical protein [Vibrio splendidus]
MQRDVVLKRAKVQFRTDCLWRLEIDDQPLDLELFAQEVSYGKGSIESDSIDVRTGMFNLPSKKTAGSVTVVFEDDEDGRVDAYIGSLQKKIFNPDGTMNLPRDYVFKLRIYRINSGGGERLDAEWSVYVEENSDHKGDNKSVSEIGTFSVTFKKFKSIGGDFI